MSLQTYKTYPSVRPFVHAAAEVLLRETRTLHAEVRAHSESEFSERAVAQVLGFYRHGFDVAAWIAAPAEEHPAAAYLSSAPLR